MASLINQEEKGMEREMEKERKKIKNENKERKERMKRKGGLMLHRGSQLSKMVGWMFWKQKTLITRLAASWLRGK